MLVTCLACNKPVFVSSAAVAAGNAQVPCGACQTVLVVAPGGSVHPLDAGGEGATPAEPTPAPAPVPVPSPAAEVTEVSPAPPQTPETFANETPQSVASPTVRMPEPGPPASSTSMPMPSPAPPEPPPTVRLPAPASPVGQPTPIPLPERPTPAPMADSPTPISVPEQPVGPFGSVAADAVPPIPAPVDPGPAPLQPYEIGPVTAAPLVAPDEPVGPPDSASPTRPADLGGESATIAEDILTEVAAAHALDPRAPRPAPPVTVPLPVPPVPPVAAPKPPITAPLPVPEAPAASPKTVLEPTQEEKTGAPMSAAFGDPLLAANVEGPAPGFAVETPFTSPGRRTAGTPAGSPANGPGLPVGTATPVIEPDGTLKPQSAPPPAVIAEAPAEVAPPAPVVAAPSGQPDASEAWRVAAASHSSPFPADIEPEPESEPRRDHTDAVVEDAYAAAPDTPVFEQHAALDASPSLPAIPLPAALSRRPPGGRPDRPISASLPVASPANPPVSGRPLGESGGQRPVTGRPVPRAVEPPASPSEARLETPFAITAEEREALERPKSSREVASAAPRVEGLASPPVGLDSPARDPVPEPWSVTGHGGGISPLGPGLPADTPALLDSEPVPPPPLESLPASPGHHAPIGDPVPTVVSGGAMHTLIPAVAGVALTLGIGALLWSFGVIGGNAATGSSAEGEGLAVAVREAESGAPAPREDAKPDTDARTAHLAADGGDDRPAARDTPVDRGRGHAAGNERRDLQRGAPHKAGRRSSRQARRNPAPATSASSEQRAVAPPPRSTPVAPPPDPRLERAEQHYKQGNLYIQERKVTLAIESLKKCIDLNARHGRAYRSLGVAYYMLGREKSAVQAYKRFVELMPTHKDAGKVRQIISDYEQRHP